MSPNPAAEQVEVSIPEISTSSETLTAESNTSSSVTSYTLTVLNSNGINLYTAKSTDKKITIPTSSFMNGLYVVVVTDGSKVYRGNLLVSH